MTGPGDEMAADPGRLRASHADREQTIEVLKAAFVHGRLTKDEFDLRAGQAFTARTYAELAAVTADIPTGPAAAEPPRQPARAQARPLAHASVKTGAGAVVSLAMLLALALIIWGHAWSAAVATMIIVPVFGVIVGGVVAAPIALVLRLESRRQKRSGGQLPPRPTPGSRASRRPASGGPPGQLPHNGHGQQHTTKAIRSNRAAPPSSGGEIWRGRGRRAFTPMSWPAVHL
jgi:hypothetical protein